jgi:N-acetylglucosaminyl-diphospho-decaprenol L-rhamnosyltransferase
VTNTQSSSGHEVSVILVTYNSRAIVMDALKPLVGQSGIEVIVVDNDSQDGTSQAINARYAAVEVVQLPDNVGFARAVNEGIRRATNPLVMLLNPDAVVGIEAVRRLASKFSDSRTGLVAPLLKNPAGHQRVVAAGYLPTLRRMVAHYSGLSRLGKRFPALRGHYLFEDQLSSNSMNVEWVTGACMIFPRAVWTEVGGLSERWFMYAEDIDFCLRVSRAGYRVRLIVQETADHLVGQSDSTESFKANPAWVLNLRDFYDRELAPSRLHGWVWSVVVGLGLLARGLAFGALTRRASGDARLRMSNNSKRFLQYGLAVLRQARSRVS